ncbi:hypothetical protein ACOMHN_048550 [Nucella lapillus]
MELSENQQELLSLGPKFCPTPRSLDHDQLARDIDEGCRRLRLKELFYESDEEEETVAPKFYKPTGYRPPTGRDYALDDYCGTLVTRTQQYQPSRRPRDNLSQGHPLFLAVVEVEAVRAILQYDVTTMAANGTVNDTDCLCDCDDLEAPFNGSAPSTHEEAEKAASQLVNELKLDKSNLSATTRRKKSAPDHRPSAQGIGVVGILVIVLVLGSVVALDFTMLVNDVKFAITRLFGYSHGNPPYRNRVPRRIRRGLRPREPRSFYGSPLGESAPTERGGHFHKEMDELGGGRIVGVGVSPPNSSPHGRPLASFLGTREERKGGGGGNVLPDTGEKPQSPDQPWALGSSGLESVFCAAASGEIDISMTSSPLS